MTDMTSSDHHGAHPARRSVVTANAPRRAGRAVFCGVAALLFAASVTATVAWSTSMAAMGEIPMSGGWSMSIMWTRVCGESWPAAAASFLGMWAVMMVAMMLPALAPVLWRYRLAVGRTRGQAADRLAALVGAGYFLVWMAFGLAIFPIGAALAMVEMQEPLLARATPVTAGVIVVIAGLLQFTAWKVHHLACRREAPGHGQALNVQALNVQALNGQALNVQALPTNAGTALQHGLRLGLHCAAGSAGLTAMLLVLGMMDLRVMAVVTAAITAERLLPDRAQIAPAIGAAIIAAGMLLIARAAGLAI
jgi:predicted metal-binding membrane protein